MSSIVASPFAAVLNGEALTDLELRVPLGEIGGAVYYRDSEEDLRTFTSLGGVVYPKVQVVEKHQWHCRDHNAPAADDPGASKKRGRPSNGGSDADDRDSRSGSETGTSNDSDDLADCDSLPRRRRRVDIVTAPPPPMPLTTPLGLPRPLLRWLSSAIPFTRHWLLPYLHQPQHTSFFRLAPALGNGHDRALNRLREMPGVGDREEPRQGGQPTPGGLRGIFANLWGSAQGQGHAAGDRLLHRHYASYASSGDWSPVRTCQALAFHHTYPVIAVAIQASPRDACVVRFYHFTMGTFLADLDLQMELQRGVTTMAWAPGARDVLAVGVAGGVLMWKVHGLPLPAETLAFTRGSPRPSIWLEGLRRLDGTYIPGTSKISVPSMLVDEVGQEQSIRSGAPLSAGYQDSSRSSRIMDRPNEGIESSLLVNGSRTMVFSGLSSRGPKDGAEGHRNVATSTTIVADEINLSTAEQRAGSIIAANACNPQTLCMPGLPRARAGLRSLGDASDATVAHAVFFPTSGGVQQVNANTVSSIAFSSDGASVLAACRQNTHIFVFDITQRPRDALVSAIPGSGGVSCLALDSLDRYCLRGSEDDPVLEFIDIRDILRHRHESDATDKEAGDDLFGRWRCYAYNVASKVLKIAPCRTIDTHAYALMLDRTEAVPIIRMSGAGGDTPELDVAEPPSLVYLRVISTSQPGRRLGGGVLDITVFHNILYVRTSSGHVLLLRLYGCLQAEQAADRAVSATVVLAMPTPAGAGNLSPVAMDVFPGYEHGSLLCVAQAEQGTLEFLPSYFIRR